MNEETYTMVIAELNKVPVGRYKLRKRLTKRLNNDGTAVYSVREYAPHPTYINGEEKAAHYVPARGIDLTEDELKKICSFLRRDLYAIRHYGDSDDREQDNNKETLEETEDTEDTEDVDDCEDIIENDNDTVCGSDFEEELDCIESGELLDFTNKEGNHIRLTLMSWHGGSAMYDLREYRETVNVCGYKELYPELDKGLQLEDIECEYLCQGVERAFPDFAKEVAQYKESDFDVNMNTVHLDLTAKERKIAVDAFSDYINYILKDGIKRNARGSRIGEYERHVLFEQLYEIERKLRNDERMTNRELSVCNDILLIQSPNNPNESILKDIRNRITDLLVQRSHMPSHDWYIGQNIYRIDASPDEFNLLADILQLVKDTLFYNDNIEVSKWLDIRRAIECLIVGNIELQNDKENLSADYKDNPGIHFLDDFIHALRNAENS